MAHNSRLLSTSEAAKILAVSPRTINRWAAEGLIPAIQLPSGVRRFRLNDVVAACASERETEPDEEKAQLPMAGKSER